jgi:hypothetical protein
MGGASSKSTMEITKTLTDITNNVTENISKTISDNKAVINLKQKMKIEEVEFFGCLTSDIAQTMEIQQSIQSELSSTQLSQIEADVTKVLSDKIENDTNAGSGAMRLPMGGSTSNTDTKVNIKKFLETNNITKNVQETISSTMAEIKADQDMGIKKISFDPCGIGMFKQALANVDILSNPDGFKKAAKAIEDSVSQCHKANPKCSVTQAVIAQQLSQAVVKTLSENIQKTGSNIRDEMLASGKASAQDKGALEEYGEAWGTALEGAGKGTADALGGAGKALEGAGTGISTAAKGVGDGTSTAAKGVGDGAGSAVKGAAEGIGGMLSSPGMIIFLLLAAAGAFMYIKSQQERI